MWLIVSLTIAFANPERPFERFQDNLRQRNYAQITGDGPVYGAKYGPIEASVFRDGMIQQYTRPLDSERHEVKRFSGIGRPLTRVLIGPSGPINVKVYGANEDYLIDVESWESHPAGPITVRAPTVPIRLSDSEQRWDLKEGSLYVAELPMDDLYHNDFRRNFEAACRCTVRDRHLTWINGQKALRLSFEQPIASRITYGTLWAMPVGDKLIAIQWISAEGNLLERPHATGRAMVALIRGEPNR